MQINQNKSSAIKILVLEDSDADIKLILRNLQKGGLKFEHRVARNKLSYLELLEKFEPDIILSDYSLPNFNGKQAFELLKEEGLSIPFILITGTLQDEVAMEVLRLGLDDYLLKDRMERLPGAVNRALERQKLLLEKEQAYQQIKASEQLFSIATKAGKTAVWEINLTKGTISTANMKQLTGYDDNDISNDISFWMNNIHPEDQPVLTKKMEEARDGKLKHLELEHRAKRKDGTYAWFYISVQRIEEKQTNEIKLIGTSTDITERKAYEEELEKLSIVASKSDNAVIITDHLGKLEWVNEGFEKLTGYSREEVKGKTPGSFLQGPKTSEHARKSISNKLKKQIPFTEEILNYTKSGETYWISLSITPIIDDNKKLVKFIGISTDISARVAAEKALRQSEARFRGFLKSAPDAVVITDSEGKITFFNKVAEQYFGYSESEVLNHEVEMLIPQRFHNGHQNYRKAFQEKPKVRKMGNSSDFVGLRKDGSEFPVDVMLGPSTVRGESNTIVIIRDITELKRAEKERREFTEKLEMKVKERTAELGEANLMLKAEVRERKRISDELAHKNKDITDSILYAERIQKAIIPNVKGIQRAFPESFVMYRPKDIVSGDFYWYDQSANDFLIVASDCTGHGVPGAFMSVLGMEILSKTVTEKGWRHPSLVLEMLDEGVVNSLRQRENTMMNDGMDVAVCQIDQQEKLINFAGAAQTVFLVRNGEIEKHRGSKFSIGGEFSLEEKKYITHKMPYEKGDMLYMLTDGYADQFGGPKNRKFMIRHLKKLLQSIHQSPAIIQKDSLECEFDKWKGQNPQVDDVMIIGIRLK